MRRVGQEVVLQRAVMVEISRQILTEWAHEGGNKGLRPSNAQREIYPLSKIAYVSM